MIFIIRFQDLWWINVKELNWLDEEDGGGGGWVQYYFSKNLYEMNEMKF